MPGTAASAMVEGVDRASLLTGQLKRGFRWMRFEPALESDYRVDQFRDGLKFLRINLVMLAAIILAIIQIDHVVMREISRGSPDLARLGIACVVPVARRSCAGLIEAEYEHMKTGCVRRHAAAAGGPKSGQ